MKYDFIFETLITVDAPDWAAAQVAAAQKLKTLTDEILIDQIVYQSPEN